MPGYIKLTRAKLCMDCDGIFEAGDTCPKCGSMTWEHLRNWVEPFSVRKSDRAAWRIITAGPVRNILSYGAGGGK
jgi:RNA polymerase subunit RPABC4/transcription elongation factor Spt4